MKYLKQFLIILVITAAAEFIHSVLPFPVPASIYGIVILFLLLVTKVVKTEDIEEVGHFLIQILPVLIVAPSVSLINSWGALRSVLLPFILIVVVSTLIVMAVSGHVTQLIVKFEKKHGKTEEEPAFDPEEEP